MAKQIDIYLLPGLDGTGRLFAPFIEKAPPWANPIVLAYEANDLRTYEELARWVVEQIGDNRDVLLLGESFSGPIAIKAASQLGCGVLGVILSATFVENSMLPLRLAPAWSVKAALHLARSRLASELVLTNFSDPKLADAVLDAVATPTIETLASRVAEIRRVDVLRELQALSCPILYLKAKHDRLVPPAASRRIAALRPDAEIIELPAPHMILQTQAEQAWAAIDDFVARATVVPEKRPDN